MKHHADGYVSHEPDMEMVFVRLDDGKIDLSIYLSNEVDSSDGIYMAIQAWADGSSPVIIAPHFSISSPVDYLVESHEMTSLGNAIDIDAKPIFDALRNEMLDQIARIDALIFLDGNNSPEQSLIATD